MGHIYVVYLAFLLGELLHIFKRASMSNIGVSSLDSLKKHVQKYWNVLIIRTVAALVCFALWTEHPQVVDNILTKYIHWDLDISMVVPPTKMVALIVGFFADSTIDFLIQKSPASVSDWLKKEIPPIPEGYVPMMPIPGGKRSEDPPPLPENADPNSEKLLGKAQP